MKRVIGMDIHRTFAEVVSGKRASSARQGGSICLERGSKALGAR